MRADRHRRPASLRFALVWLAPVWFVLAAACGGASAQRDEAQAAATETGSADSVRARAGPDLSGVKLRVGDQINLAKTLIEVSGEAEDAPYDIEWSSFAAGPPMLEAISAGAIDLGFTGDAPPIFAQSAGAAIKIVAVSAGRKPGQSHVSILVPKDSPIQTVADLKGKKVAFPQGSAAHWLVLAALDKASLKASDIQAVYLPAADGLAAFTGGSIDAWAVWDPYVALGERQGGRTITTGAGVIGGFLFQVARAGALDDPKLEAAIGDYLRRMSRAATWAVTHKDVWAKHYARITKLPAAVVASTLDRFELTYFPIDRSVADAQQSEADAFAAAGLIPKAIDVNEVFDFRYAATPSG
jgi:sulfonate transport system substrate-binding protein